MRRLARWFLFTAIVLLLAATGLAGLGAATVRRSFPQLEGTLALPGLSSSVEVLRDAYGVPQIYADSAEDLFEAQGYVHAQDRFYEMDVRRHITAGRLSELFGASQVETDTYLRTLGWRRIAEQELPLLSSSSRRYLDAYASGVNAYLRGRSPSDIALEYGVLGLQGAPYRPEEWTAVDSLAWLKAMAWNLGANLDQEVEVAIMTGKVGAVRAAELFPGYPFQGFSPIVSGGTVVKGRFDPAASGNARSAPAGLSRDELAAAEPAFHAASRVGATLRRWLQPTGNADLGSNSWVVAGTRTASGKPLLSNDQHLATSIPSIYAQVGLHCRTVSDSCPFDVAGFSFAGMPGVITGHNASIAWGFTTSYVDAQDLYLEELAGDRVRVGQAYQPLQVRTEQINVRNGEPRTITIRASRHGPVLSDADAQLREIGANATEVGQPAYAVALAWTALTPNRALDGLFAVNRATTFDQFRAGIALVAAPSQSVVYADTAGNIGFQLMGSLPLRSRGDGVMPMPGWDLAYDWKGTVPFAEQPFLYNPPSGVIVAANQQVIGRQYRHRVGSTYSYGWRSEEIADILANSAPLTVDRGEQISYDDTVRFAAELVPLLLKVKVKDGWIREGQNTLVGWDYSATADSASAAYFHVVVHDILKRTFRDEMPEELWPSGGDRWYAVLSALLRQPSSRWWDDASTRDTVESRNDILLAAMGDARRELTSLMARDTDQWGWGKLHRVTLRNQTLGRSGIGLVERLFNRGDFPVSGGPAVVNAMGYNDNDGYRVTYGPAMRMVVDLSNLDASLWVNQTGVSGHAFDPHYDDQTQLWATNRTWSFLFRRASVEAATKYRLTLSPPG